jgi:hypothetical protein
MRNFRYLLDYCRVLSQLDLAQRQMQTLMVERVEILLNFDVNVTVDDDVVVAVVVVVDCGDLYFEIVDVLRTMTTVKFVVSGDVVAVVDDFVVDDLDCLEHFGD